MSSRAAWNVAAVSSETGSRLMSANAAVGKATAGLGRADATMVAEGLTVAG
jgi:hypothetical protein